MLGKIKWFQVKESKLHMVKLVRANWGDVFTVFVVQNDTQQDDQEYSYYHIDGNHFDDVKIGTVVEAFFDGDEKLQFVMVGEQILRAYRMDF